MDEKTRMEYARRMECVRAMTDAEIADMQRRQAPLMMNDADQMRGAAGVQNFWRVTEVHWIPEPPKPTFWQRLYRRASLAMTGWAAGYNEERTKTWKR